MRFRHRPTRPKRSTWDYLGGAFIAPMHGSGCVAELARHAAQLRLPYVRSASAAADGWLICILQGRRLILGTLHELLKAFGPRHREFGVLLEQIHHFGMGCDQCIGVLFKPGLVFTEANE